MKVYTLHECSALIAETFQKDYLFTNITVQGTVSNLHVHFSGMIFFSLIDEKEKIACKIGRQRSTFLGRRIQNGAEVSILGTIKYDKIQGQSFLQVERVLAAKDSPLVRKQEALAAELEEKGYFKEENKKRLPRFPFQIGIVTSGSGAVIYDILRTGMGRNNSITYRLYSTSVQGEGAAESMAKSIYAANMEMNPPDVLIVARGGGSEEDLSPFNEKVLLEAAFSSHIPIVSAIGHESDITLFDKVADRRASTPTQAAEIVIPEKRYIKENIGRVLDDMTYHMKVCQKEKKMLCCHHIEILRTRGEKKIGITERNQIRAFCNIIQKSMRRTTTDKKMHLLEVLIHMADKL